METTARKKIQNRPLHSTICFFSLNLFTEILEFRLSQKFTEA